MKKLLFITFMLLIISKISFAQTTPAINDSFTTKDSPLIVYPYDPAKGKPDMKIHFLLNANTKYYLSKILDSGYIIRVWHFSDQVNVRKRDTTGKYRDSVYNKKDFYDKLVDLTKAKLILAKAKIYQDSVAKENETAQQKLSEAKITNKSAIANLKKVSDQFSQAQRNLTSEINKINIPQKKKTKSTTDITSLSKVKKDIEAKTTTFENAKSSLTSQASHFVNNISISIDTIDLNKKILAFDKAKSSLDTQAVKLNAIKITKKNSKVVKAKTQVLNYKPLVENATDEVKSSLSDLVNAKDNSNETSIKLDSANAKVARAYRTVTSLGRIQSQVSKLPSNDTVYRMYKASANTYTDTISKDNQSPAAKYDSLAFVDSWGNYMQFFLPLKNFSDCSQIYPRNSHFTWGFLSVPLKIRVAPFSFEQDVNFGITFGWRFQRVSTVNIANNILMGISVGSVKLTAPTTAITATPASNATTTSAVSFSLGYMFQYDKFQVGGFVGWDIAGDNRSQFINANTPYFGIAIGVSLFGENKTAAGVQTQK